MLGGVDRDLEKVAALAAAPLVGQKAPSQKPAWLLIKPPTCLYIAVDPEGQYFAPASVPQTRAAILNQIRAVLRAQGATNGQCRPGGRRLRGRQGRRVPHVRQAQIIGAKLHSGSAEATAALSWQGRYQDIAANLKVKEVRIAEDERFIICYNPEGAERDAAARARTLAQLGELIKDSDKLSRDKRAELRGVISTKPGLNRYLRVTPAGCCAPTPARSKPRRTWTASTCSGHQTQSCRPRTSPWATSSSWKSSAAGAT
jgi:hypothetical protein